MSWISFSTGLLIGGTLGTLVMGVLASDRVFRHRNEADLWRRKYVSLEKIMTEPLLTDRR